MKTVAIPEASYESSPDKKVLTELWLCIRIMKSKL
jgi:hypothetical protein